MNPMAERGLRPVVLLVNDDVDLLATTSALLEPDFEVITASTAEEALRRFAQSDPDVVCSDYGVPGMNGIELLRVTMNERRYVSGILLSGYREYVDYPAKNGADRYLLLVKPYAPNALTHLLNTAVRYTSMKRKFAANGSGQVA